jgi:hypothetical protein
MSLKSGAKLGPYEIVSAVGAGGMGEVYRAKDARLDRYVAIKVLPSSVASDPERLRRFEQEARATGVLNHPNILAIYDIGTHESAPYLVSELLEGQTLRERLTESALPVRKAIEYGVQIARGLAAAHEKGIVHRDLKPENLFITNAGQIKILDFGLAKLIEPAGSASDIQTAGSGTDPGIVLGTVGYMSPEQVRGKVVDQRSDIFNFGAILYEMISGVHAFHADSGVEIMNAILKEDPPDLAGRASNVSPALSRLIRRCLEKNSDERFRSAQDVAFALEAMSESSTSAGMAAMPEARHGAARSVIAAIVAVILLGAAFFVGRRTAPADESPGFMAPTFKRLAFRRGIDRTARALARHHAFRSCRHLWKSGRRDYAGWKSLCLQSPAFHVRSVFGRRAEVRRLPASAGGFDFGNGDEVALQFAAHLYGLTGELRKLGIILISDHIKFIVDN